MIHIIKNYKWVIATSLICIIFGLLTFFTFTNQSFITLKDLNLQILLIADLILSSKYLCNPTLNKTRENIAIIIEGNRVVVEKKSIYFKLV